MLIKPISAAYAIFCLATWSADVNCIKPKTPSLAGHKKNAICKFFDVPTLKKIALKYNKCTVNDVVLAMASVSLKQYMTNHGDPD